MQKENASRARAATLETALGAQAACSSGQIGLGGSGIRPIRGVNVDNVQDLPIQAFEVLKQLILSLINQFECRVLVFLAEQNRRFPSTREASIPEHP